jgi:SAM-dependent methyltransferase
MRGRLAGRLPAGPLATELVDAPAERLPFAAGAFDTVVATLVLCSVADLDCSVAEARRVLRPAGRLLFLEHVAAAGRAGAVQRLLQPAYGRLAGGCHLHRDTERALAGGGFAIQRIGRFEPPVGQGRLFPSIEGLATPGRRARHAAR